MQEEASKLAPDNGLADHARRILGDSMLFRGLGPNEKKALFARLSVNRFAAGRTIFLQGSPGDSIMAVLAGNVRISVSTTDGHPLVLALMTAGDIFGEIAVLDGKERTTDAIAITECSIATLARSDILSFLHTHPAAWQQHRRHPVRSAAPAERSRRGPRPAAALPGAGARRRSSACAGSPSCATTKRARRCSGSAKAGHGLFVVLSGKVDLVRQDELGNSKSFLSFGPGGVIGEMAQLSGRPVMVDGYAQGAVDALGHSAGPAARAPDRRSRARRADHGCAHPAPRRHDREGHRRPGDRRPRRERRRAAPEGLPEPQRSPLRMAERENRSRRPRC